MNRLWIRLSIAISSVIAIIFIILFIGLYFTLNLSDPSIFETLTNESEQFDQLWWEVPEAILKASIYASVLGVAGGVIVSRILSNPMTNLVNAARRIGAGDLDTRIELSGAREIDELANTFNQMAADLKEAQAQRQRLMADVAHELRTPLTVLEGNLRAAIEQIYVLEPDDLVNLYSQTRHLIHLVNDLRELALAEAKQLPMNIQPLAIDDLISEVVEIFEPIAVETNVILKTELDEHLPVIKGDEARLRQVLDNLIANAIRHSHDGGVVTVSALRDNDRLHLSVSDTGDGIAPEQLAVIFDRFSRVDTLRSPQNGSSGLGLTIVKAIVEAHAGKIQAQSTGLGQGSRFVVSIPCDDVM
ncbi:MAG: ATP-binding protein [Chloroflexota bacterium]